MPPVKAHVWWDQSGRTFKRNYEICERRPNVSPSTPSNWSLVCRQQHWEKSSQPFLPKVLTAVPRGTKVRSSRVNVWCCFQTQTAVAEYYTFITHQSFLPGQEQIKKPKQDLSWHSLRSARARLHPPRAIPSIPLANSAQPCEYAPIQNICVQAELKRDIEIA